MSLDGQSDGRSPRKRGLQHQLTTATRLTFRSAIGRSLNVSRCRDLQLLRSHARSSRVATERCRVALLLIDPQPGKYITRQPVDSASIEGSISRGMSSTFGSGECVSPPHPTGCAACVAFWCSG
eukprot:2142087-Prymnesium_polylepis.1